MYTALRPVCVCVSKPVGEGQSVAVGLGRDRGRTVLWDITLGLLKQSGCPASKGNRSQASVKVGSRNGGGNAQSHCGFGSKGSGSAASL